MSTICLSWARLLPFFAVTAEHSCFPTPCPEWQPAPRFPRMFASAGVPYDELVTPASWTLPPCRWRRS